VDDVTLLHSLFLCPRTVMLFTVNCLQDFCQMLLQMFISQKFCFRNGKWEWSMALACFMPVAHKTIWPANTELIHFARRSVLSTVFEGMLLLLCVLMFMQTHWRCKIALRLTTCMIIFSKMNAKRCVISRKALMPCFPSWCAYEGLIWILESSH